MIENNSVKLKFFLNKVYNLSRQNEKESVLCWIFLDSDRIKNYYIFLNLLPASNKVGIILRSKKKKLLYNQVKLLNKICKKKKFKFLVASNYILAKSIGADGVHYPKQIKFARKDKTLLTSCSFHGYNDYMRYKKLYADLVFISPAFNTQSHLNKKELGLTRISLLANYVKCQYSVLGGVSNKNLKKLRCRGVKSVAGLSFICETIDYKC